MAHMITQIRDQVASTLNSMATVPAARVFVNRVYPIELLDMPCVVINTGGEVADIGGFGRPGYLSDRTLNVDVVICVSAKTNYDSTASQIQLEVEKALAGNESLSGLVTSIRYTGRQKSMSGDGEKPFVAVTMTYDARYRVNSSSPDVAA